MEVEFSVSREDYGLYVRYLRRRFRIRFFVTAFLLPTGLLLAFLPITVKVGQAVHVSFVEILWIWGIGYLAMTAWLAWYTSLRRATKVLTKDNGEDLVRLGLTPKGIEGFTQKGGNSLEPWNSVKEIAESKELFLMVTQDKSKNFLAVVVPRRAFADHASYAVFRDEAQRLWRSRRG